MNKQTEALKLALEALRDYRRSDDDRISVAMGILQEALAEQPAQQQEPVATDWERIARVQDAKLRAMCEEPGCFEKLCEVMNRYERTSPPASKPWRGLTEQERNNLEDYCEMIIGKAAFEAIEAKLREKNA